MVHGWVVWPGSPQETQALVCRTPQRPVGIRSAPEAPQAADVISGCPEFTNLLAGHAFDEISGLAAVGATGFGAVDADQAHAHRIARPA